MSRDTNIHEPLRDTVRRVVSLAKTQKSLLAKPAMSKFPASLPVPLWTIVLAVAIVLIVLGVMQGDATDVWRKASLICYECIGIG